MVTSLLKKVSKLVGYEWMVITIDSIEKKDVHQRTWILNIDEGDSVAQIYDLSFYGTKFGYSHTSSKQHLHKGFVSEGFFLLIRRFAAVDGWVYTRSCRTKNNDVLLRVPQTLYFRTRYREMSILMAHSSEI